jgi:PAS domain S-box-containing protein
LPLSGNPGDAVLPRLPTTETDIVVIRKGMGVPGASAGLTSGAAGGTDPPPGSPGIDERPGARPGPQAELPATSSAPATSSERLGLVALDQAPDAILIHDLEGHIIEANRRASISLGYTRDELLARTIFDLECTLGPERLAETWASLAPGERVTVQTRHRRQDASTFAAEWRLGLVETPAGQRVIVVARDLTESQAASAVLDAARERAEADARAKSRALALVGHEARAPLAAVSSLVQALYRSHLLDADGRANLEVVERDCEILLGIMDGILEHSSAEADALCLVSEPFDLHEVIESVLEVESLAAHRKGLDVVSLVDDDVPGALLGDPGRLAQILGNLLSNAVKYTERGNVSLRISTERMAGDTALLRFSVCDSGRGIATEQAEEVFLPYVQGNAGVRQPGEGVGLGLSIARHLVGLMEGELRVDSRPGEGSCFSFTARLAMQRSLRAVPRVARLEGLRILIVDDCDASREVLAAYASSAGMRPLLAADATQARAILRDALDAADPVAIALVDAALPAQAGLDLVRSLGTDPTRHATKAVLLVPIGASMSGQGRCGPAIAKPVRQSRFPAAIDRLLDANVRAAACRPNPVVGTATRPTNPPAVPARRKVLLIEGSTATRLGMRMLLEELGCEVVAVGDGEAGLAAGRVDAFDLILMDCHLADVSASELVAALRSGGRKPAAPVVGITANVSDGERRRYRRIGMDALVAKPARRDGVAEVLRRHAHRPEGAKRVATTQAPCPADPRRRQLLQLFVADGIARLRDLRRALESGSREQLARQAHTMLGGCHQIGEQTISAPCDRLVRHAKNGRLDEAGESLDELEAAFAALHRKMCTPCDPTAAARREPRATALPEPRATALPEPRATALPEPRAVAPRTQLDS